MKCLPDIIDSEMNIEECIHKSYLSVSFSETAVDVTGSAHNCDRRKATILASATGCCSTKMAVALAKRISAILNMF